MLGGDAFVGTGGLGAEGDPDLINSLRCLGTPHNESLASEGKEEPNLLDGGPGSSPPLWTGWGQPTDTQKDGAIWGALSVDDCDPSLPILPSLVEAADAAGGGGSGLPSPSKDVTAGPDLQEFGPLLENLDFLLMNPGGGGIDSAERPPPPPVTTPEGGTTPENDAEPQNGGGSIHEVGNPGPEQTRKRSNQSSGASSRNKRRRGCDPSDPREYYNNPNSSIERLKQKTEEAIMNTDVARKKALIASQRADRAKLYAEQLKRKAALVECYAKQLGQRASQMAVEKRFPFPDA